VEVTESSVLLLPFTASSVGVARRNLVSDLIEADVRGTAITDAALVISELFANALQHGKPLPGEAVRAAWDVEGGCLRLAVSDGGGSTRPELGEPTPATIGGRGLRIVARLSLRWGTVSDHDGTTVWAEVQLTPQPAVAATAAAAERGLTQRSDVPDGGRAAASSGNSQLALTVVTWFPGPRHGKVGSWSLMSRVDIRMITPS
jgi:anti-sigma regulatory factor (Ser/Thr protein kinase)